MATQHAGNRRGANTALICFVHYELDLVLFSFGKSHSFLQCENMCKKRSHHHYHHLAMTTQLNSVHAHLTKKYCMLNWPGADNNITISLSATGDLIDF